MKEKCLVCFGKRCFLINTKELKLIIFIEINMRGIHLSLLLDQCPQYVQYSNKLAFVTCGLYSCLQLLLHTPLLFHKLSALCNASFCFVLFAYVCDCYSILTNLDVISVVRGVKGYVVSSTAAANTKMLASRSHENRTKLQHEQRSSGE
jgi:hypothetical protein